MMSDNTSDPARIERDLDQTRSRLGSHLSELQDRLSPGQVLDDLMGYFRGSEGAAFGRSLVDNIRANPMPAALTGIGLAWLMASNPRQGTPSGSAGRSFLYTGEDHARMLARVREAEQGVNRLSEEADDAYASRLDAARGQAMGLTRDAQETAASFGQRVRDMLASAQDAVVGKAQDLRDQAGDAASATSDAIGSLGSSAQGALRGAVDTAGSALSAGGQAGGNLVAAVTESPVMLGALGLAAGALLGALLPRMEQEQAALGGIAGQVREKATSLAQQGMEGGKRVAQEVADKARESAGGHGLTGSRTPGQLADAALSGELAGGAKEVVQDVLHTGDEAVRREASAPADTQPTSSPRAAASSQSPKQ